MEGRGELTCAICPFQCSRLPLSRPSCIDRLHGTSRHYMATCRQALHTHTHTHNFDCSFSASPNLSGSITFAEGSFFSKPDNIKKFYLLQNRPEGLLCGNPVFMCILVPGKAVGVVRLSTHFLLVLAVKNYWNYNLCSSCKLLCCVHEQLLLLHHTTVREMFV